MKLLSIAGVACATGLLVVVACPLRAATCGGLAGVNYYVAPSGTDTNPCSATSPCRQIRQALTLVHPGDIVHVADGVYLGFTAEGIAGTAVSPITLLAQGTNAYVQATTDRSVSDIGAYEFGAVLTPPQMTLQFIGIDACISFPMLITKTYRIETADDLQTGFSNILTDNVPGTSDPFFATDPNAPAHPQRFYRVRVGP